MHDLNSIDKFGGIDADSDDLLDECFEDHEAYIAARDHDRFLILGRKGSGKTAIFRKFIRTRKYDLFSFGHTFSDYHGTTMIDSVKLGSPMSSASSTAGNILF